MVVKNTLDIQGPPEVQYDWTPEHILLKHQTWRGTVENYPQKWKGTNLGDTPIFHRTMTTWWLNQPIWKIWVMLEIFPNFRGEIKKCLKPPPRWLWEEGFFFTKITTPKQANPRNHPRIEISGCGWFMKIRLLGGNSVDSKLIQQWRNDPGKKHISYRIHGTGICTQPFSPCSCDHFSPFM